MCVYRARNNNIILKAARTHTRTHGCLGDISSLKAPCYRWHIFVNLALVADYKVVCGPIENVTHDVAKQRVSKRDYTLLGVGYACVDVSHVAQSVSEFAAPLLRSLFKSSVFIMYSSGAVFWAVGNGFRGDETLLLSECAHASRAQVTYLIFIKNARRRRSSTR